jgi:hypothetical protein
MRCCRTLIQTTYTEYLSGGNYPYDQVFLKEFPVIAITRLATSPRSALTVTADSNTNQRATIATTATGVTLTRVASGVSTSSSLTFATYPTITALAAAISALSGGWTATVQGPYALWSSADLKPLQGAYTVLNGGADLQIWTEEMGAATNPNWVSNDGYDDDWGPTTGWRLDEDAGILFGRFPRGHLNIRADYTAGFAVVPEDLQEACAQCVLDYYNAGRRDHTIQSEGLGPYNVTYSQLAKLPGLSDRVRNLCSYYKDRGAYNRHR